MSNRGFLAHYGVQGMKWGVRHDKKGSSTVSYKSGGKLKSGNRVQKMGGSSENPKEHSDSKSRMSDHEKAQKIKSKSLSEMSNQELEFLLKRQRLEKSYNELNPPQVSTGKKIFAGIAAIGTTALAAVTKADQIYNAYEKIIKLSSKTGLDNAVNNTVDFAKKKVGIG